MFPVRWKAKAEGAEMMCGELMKKMESMAVSSEENKFAAKDSDTVKASLAAADEEISRLKEQLLDEKNNSEVSHMPFCLRLYLT